MPTAGADNDSLKASLICERVTRDDLQALSVNADILPPWYFQRFQENRKYTRPRAIDTELPRLKKKKKKDRLKGRGNLFYQREFLSLYPPNWNFKLKKKSIHLFKIFKKKKRKSI